MSRARIVWCALAALTVIGGCNRDDMLKKFASDQDQKVARQCIDTLRHRNFAEIEARLDPSLRSPDTRALLEKAANLLPPREPDAVILVGAQLNTADGVRSSNLTYQFSYGEQHFMINCATRAEGKARIIFGLTVNVLEGSLEQQSRFDLKGKSGLQYSVLIAGIVFLVLSLVALIRCIMEKNLRRKWLWIICILFGIGQLSVNWNSGTWEFSPVHLLLFSASALSPGYGPWVVSVALPVGAAWYLIRRFLNHRAAARSNVG